MKEVPSSDDTLKMNGHVYSEADWRLAGSQMGVAISSGYISNIQVTMVTK